MRQHGEESPEGGKTEDEAVSKCACTVIATCSSRKRRAALCGTHSVSREKWGKCPRASSLCVRPNTRKRDTETYREVAPVGHGWKKRPFEQSPGKHEANTTQSEGCGRWGDRNFRLSPKSHNRRRETQAHQVSATLKSPQRQVRPEGTPQTGRF